MHRPVATALLAAGLLGLTACSNSGLSQDALVLGCLKALRSDPTADATHRPDACKGLTEENYTTVQMHAVLQDQGAVDENGDVDLGGVGP